MHGLIGSKSPLLDELLLDRLIWLPERGLGYYPVPEGPETYDQRYFDRFAEQADTPLGRALMDFRVRFVAQHYRGDLLDVGIGSGAFIEAREGTWGYDVNPAGRDWLRLRHLWRDPHRAAVPAVSLWDVLEHIHDPRELLANVQGWVFASLPIFTGPEHVLRSKHFRRDEHCWYFTTGGLVRLMEELGFSPVAMNKGETELGREDIETFAFRRN